MIQTTTSENWKDNKLEMSRALLEKAHWILSSHGSTSHIELVPTHELFIFIFLICIYVKKLFYLICTFYFVVNKSCVYIWNDTKLG